MLTATTDIITDSGSVDGPDINSLVGEARSDCPTRATPPETTQLGPGFSHDTNNLVTYQEQNGSKPLDTPPNFGMVASGIYRSAYPRPEHFPFLKQLELKSVLVLISEQYPEESLQFIESTGTQLFQIPLSGNKEPFVNVDPKDIARALDIVLNPANQPILIHCNQGKHRTGCVVGCLRRAQGWSLSLIFDEYRRYANPKARALDQLLIEMFEPDPRLPTENLWS